MKNKKNEKETGNTDNYKLDEAMLFYVAMTRAKHKVYNVSSAIYSDFDMDEKDFSMEKFIETYYNND
jgi:ATP-dependent exoDNAse (exonuclease V) beta subunit